MFLTDGDTAGEDMASTNSMMWPAIKKEMEIRELCESSYSGLKAIRGLISEFKFGRFVKSGNDWIQEPWIEASHFGSVLHEIATYEFEAKTINIYAPDEAVVTLSGDDLLNNSLKPDGGEYPDVWLHERC